MQSSFTQNTIDQYVDELLETTGASKLSESERQEAAGKIRVPFEKSVMASTLSAMTAEEKAEFERLIAAGNGEDVLAFIAKVNGPELEQAIIAGLEQVKSDFLEHFKI